MSKEYIEKGVLLARIRESRANNTHIDSRDRHAHDTEHRHFEYMVFTAEPADVKPVVRGEWVTLGNGQLVQCSVCKFINAARAHNFCPNCGAEMR